MKYDNIGRLVGSHKTSDNDASIDTINVKQRFFYDDQNRLIKEQFTNPNDVVHFVEFVYDGDLIIKKIETKENDTIGIRNYRYDQDILVSVSGKLNLMTYEEHYFYDTSGNLVEKITQSDQKPKGRKMYSYYDQKKRFTYDQQGRLIETRIFSVSEDSYYAWFYEYH